MRFLSLIARAVGGGGGIEPRLQTRALLLEEVTLATGPPPQTSSHWIKQSGCVARKFAHPLLCPRRVRKNILRILAPLICLLWLQAIPVSTDTPVFLRWSAQCLWKEKAWIASRPMLRRAVFFNRAAAISGPRQRRRLRRGCSSAHIQELRSFGANRPQRLVTFVIGYLGPSTSLSPQPAPATRPRRTS
jgi:hypothetical protein